MNITYLVFGDQIQNYQQALFSILTLQVQQQSSDRFIVVTDYPEFFKCLQDRVTIIEINADTLREWEGPHKFFWRVKIKALLTVADRWKDTSILYLDSDTFLYGSLDNLRHELDRGQNIMHLNEGNMRELKTKTERLMWSQIKHKTYGGVPMDDTKCMWNAGAIGVSKLDKTSLELALQICDEMCADKVTRRLIEQFAFSVALNEYTPLKAADDEIGHYWGNKGQWNTLISNFFLKHFFTGKSVDVLLSEIEQLDLEQYPIRLKVSNTRLRLQKKLVSLFPDKQPVYVKKIIN
ncbi:hypothetical protein [Flavobacterium sp. JP2137]|uniref:hypothetical protein n=1 Tax=Flavobacterium sp. JP2137 TaxID=3414510 RepID=UPI003D2FDB09